MHKKLFDKIMVTDKASCTISVLKISVTVSFVIILDVLLDHCA